MHICRKKNIIKYTLVVITIILLYKIYFYYNHPAAIFNHPLVLYIEPYCWDKWGHNEKFWLHRTDNIHKLTTTALKYDGVELDLNYFSEENNFDVSHDKQDKLEYPIDEFITHIKKHNQKVWFDYKNLSIDNAKASMMRLDEILTKNKISKDKCIIESSNYTALKIFHDNGYYTSYYVPVGEYFLSSKEGENLFIKKITSAVNSGNVNAVSFPVAYYDLVKKSDVNVDYLTWRNSSENWLYFYFVPKLNKILNDDKIKVILVFEKSKVER